MESRLNKVTKNMTFHLLYEAIIVVLGFLVPRFIIQYYGSEVNGLSSTISQTVKLVTLLQAGIATAATYSLYKPVNNHDNQEISMILASTKKTFRKIGIAVLCLGFFVSLALAFFINGELGPLSIYIACFLFFIKTSLDLYVTQSYRVFLTACQNNYLLSISYTIEHVIYYGLTLAVIFLRMDFIFMYVVLLFGCILKVVYLTLVFRRQYEPYRVEIPKGTELPKIDGMQYATYNEISHSVVVASIPVIISLSCGLTEASIYSVYMMIFNLLVILSKSVYSSFASSYGSVTATGDKEHINNVFEIFQYCFFALTAWMFMCASVLMLSFVGLYTQDIADSNYINSELMVLTTIYGCFYSFRIPYNLTVSANGVFKETFKQPVISAIIAIVLSIAITRFNFVYALWGPILFYITNTFYQHFKLQRCVKGFICRHFYRHFAVAVIGVGAAIAFAICVGIKANGYISWALSVLLVAVASAVILLALSFLLDRKSITKSMQYFWRKIEHR